MKNSKEIKRTATSETTEFRFSETVYAGMNYDPIKKEYIGIDVPVVFENENGEKIDCHKTALEWLAYKWAKTWRKRHPYLAEYMLYETAIHRGETDRAVLEKNEQEDIAKVTIIECLHDGTLPENAYMRVEKALDEYVGVKNEHAKDNKYRFTPTENLAEKAYIALLTVGDLESVGLKYAYIEELTPDEVKNLEPIIEVFTELLRQHPFMSRQKRMVAYTKYTFVPTKESCEIVYGKSDEKTAELYNKHVREFRQWISESIISVIAKNPDYIEALEKWIRANDAFRG